MREVRKGKEEKMIVDIPCKIGDTVYAIRKFNGVPVIRKGKVSAMYYLDDMRLAIVVRGIARGMWGKVIFASYEEAEKAIAERKHG